MPTSALLDAYARLLALSLKNCEDEESFLFLYDNVILPLGFSAEAVEEIKEKCRVLAERHTLAELETWLSSPASSPIRKGIQKFKTWQETKLERECAFDSPKLKLDGALKKKTPKPKRKPKRELASTYTTATHAAEIGVNAKEVEILERETQSANFRLSEAQAQMPVEPHAAIPVPMSMSMPMPMPMSMPMHTSSIMEDSASPIPMHVTMAEQLAREVVRAQEQYLHALGIYLQVSHGLVKDIVCMHGPPPFFEWSSPMNANAPPNAPLMLPPHPPLTHAWEGVKSGPAHLPLNLNCREYEYENGRDHNEDNVDEKENDDDSPVVSIELEEEADRLPPVDEVWNLQERLSSFQAQRW
jgi:hypothetical protein